MAEQYLHKNRLQEYAQRSGISFPLYQTVNEGSQHAPQYRSTVLIDGTAFRSSVTFPHRKEAEQDVAQLALENLPKKIKQDKQDNVPLIQDTTFCKSILNEYAVKMHLDMPRYNTYQQQQGPVPLFISSVIFAEKTYTGPPGRNKKAAEQLGAQAVIESILGSPNSRTLMSQIIKSKNRLCPAVNEEGIDRTLVLGGHVENHSTNDAPGRKELQTNLTNDMSLTVVSRGELASAAAPQSFPLSHEEYACKVDSGSTGSGISIPALITGDMPVGSTSKGLKTDESHLAHCNGAMEISSISQSVLCPVSRGKLLDGFRKRSHENDKAENPSKKSRTDEQEATI